MSALCNWIDGVLDSVWEVFEMKKFKHTIKALKEFDDKKPIRDSLWDHASSDDDIVSAIHVENVDVDKVRESFYLDTQDRNSKDRCMLVDINWIRKVVS